MQLFRDVGHQSLLNQLPPAAFFASFRRVVYQLGQPMSDDISFQALTHSFLQSRYALLE